MKRSEMTTGRLRHPAKGLRIARFVSAFVSFLVACSVVRADGWVLETASPNPQAALCQPLLQRLRSVPQQCARDALETYSEFTSAPWQILDVNKHVDLLAKLIFYGSGASKDTRFDADRFRPRARDFIDRGGELRLWRTRFISSYGDEPAPPGEQTIVMLVDKYQTTNSHAVDCPGHSSKGWLFRTFVVLPDLSGPDLRVEHGLAYLIAPQQLAIYHGEPLLLSTQVDYSIDTVPDDGGSASVWKNYPPVGLRPVCSFRFVGSRIGGHGIGGRKEK
jgi:hypothetical protein